MSLDTLTQWLTTNESALSAVAALIIIVGLLLSPFGRFLRGSERRNKVKTNRLEASSSGTRRAIFISPFTTIGNDDKAQLITLGLIGELSNAMSRTSGTSIVLSEEKADYVLSGTLFYEASRVRILATLTDGNQSTQLWSQEFKGSDSSIMDLRQKICAAIAIELGGEFMSQEFSRMDSSSTKNADAWSYVVHSAHMVIQRGGGSTVWDEAIAVANRAVKLDSNYAAAHARLAALYAERVWMFLSKDINKDIEQSVACAERAIELAAFDPYVLMNCGQGFCLSGQQTRGHEILTRALKAIPHDVLCQLFYWANLASIGNKEACREALITVYSEIEAYPNHPIAPLLGGVAALLNLNLGNHQQAKSLLQRTYDLMPGMSFYGVIYSGLLKESGELALADSVKNDLLSRGFNVSRLYFDELFSILPAGVSPSIRTLIDTNQID